MAALPDEIRADIAASYGEKTATFYDSMMEGEMQKEHVVAPLRTLADLIRGRPGALLDTSCGGGHMLEWWAATIAKADGERPLIGRDVSTDMLAVAQRRAGKVATISEGSMTALVGIPDRSCAAVVNCFAIHHVNEEMVQQTLSEAHRVLADEGCLLLEWWEGEGEMDEDGEAGFVGYKNLWAKDKIVGIAAAAGLTLKKIDVVEEKEFEMMMALAHFVRAAGSTAEADAQP